MGNGGNKPGLVLVFVLPSFPIFRAALVFRLFGLTLSSLSENLFNTNKNIFILRKPLFSSSSLLGPHEERERKW
jgi:hypothetical protein